jgi:Protein of unknown function (DUF551)
MQTDETLFEAHGVYWIDREKQAPPEDQDILVWGTEEDLPTTYHIVEYCTYHISGHCIARWENKDVCGTVEFRYWMPLPQPPQE